MFFKNNEMTRGGLVFTFAVIANLIFQLIVSSIMQILGITSFSESYPMFVIAQTLLPCATLFAAWLYCRNPAFKQKSVWSWKRPRLIDALFAVVLGLAICFASGFLNDLIAKGFEAIGIPNSLAESLPAAETGIEVVVYFVILCALPAFSEEMIFRGAMLSFFSSAKVVTACLLSGFLFGLMHMNLFQLPNAVVAGFILALVTIRTGSIVLPMIAHFVNNATTVVLQFVYAVTEPPVLFLSFTVFDVVMAAVSALFLAFVVWYCLTKRKEVNNRVQYVEGAAPLEAGRTSDAWKGLAAGGVIALLFLILSL